MEELLTCSVCCERYCENERQPVLLPRCGHSFCRPCVTLLLSGGCVICPTCRTDQRVDSAHRLPTEFTLLAIIAAQENTKLDNCRRHDVKLSFWCKTCNLATCGECLFEDHPTHCHTVIRATTYIQNIKDSVQEVASKFMEALDNREQNFYKTVYSCAQKIDESLRNVTVLRKDMSDARQLIKGVKEEDVGISTATSLSEAAKFLGLKWNIQDANFNRNNNTETEKPAVEAPPPEEKEPPKKLKGTKKKKRLSLAEIPEKKEEQQEEKKEEDDSKPVAFPEPVVPTQTQEAETLKDSKRKIPSIKKSKTLAVFEPLSMDKEITDIKEKIVELDNKERERIEEEKMKIIEEEEEEENKKKVMEQKKEEAKEAADAAVAAVDAISKEKQRKLQEKEEEEAKRRAAELEAKNKAAEEELEKLNAMLKKPKGKTARKYMASKIDSESSKLELENKAAGKKGKDVTEADENKSGKEEEKTNGEPEIIDKDKDEDTSEAQGESSEADVYAGELTPEEKEAHELAELQKKEADAMSIFDFMKQPLFTVCVEGSEGRLAILQWESRGLHIYCHQFQQLDYDIALKAKFLHALIPSKNPLVFLELTVGTSRARRIYIKLWGHLRRAHNFLALCLGDQGSAFLNTKLLQTYNANEPGERILGGDHEYNCGRGGCALLDDLEWNGDYAMPMQEGLITAAGSGQQATNSLFLICTQSDESRNFSCPFGEVVDGLDDVRDCVMKATLKEEEIWITECGVVLEPPRI